MTTTTTNAPVQTAADLLAQAGNIGADLATAPSTQVPAETSKTIKEVLSETAATGIEVAKAGSDKVMGFVAEHKTSFLVGAGVAVAAGAGYGLYKWHKKRQAQKTAKTEQAKAEEAKV